MTYWWLKCARCTHVNGCWPECERPLPTYMTDNSGGHDVPEYLRAPDTWKEPRHD